jgi:hypothetical protein
MRVGVLVWWLGTQWWTASATAAATDGAKAENLNSAPPRGGGATAAGANGAGE